MTDEDLKKIRGLIKEEIQPIHEQLKELGPIKEQLKELGPIKDQLNNPETGLKGLSVKIDNITTELSHVHKLAEATYDLAKLEPQKRRQEINEIREHVGLPVSH